MKRIITIGKPTHLKLGPTLTACGLVGSTHAAAFDPRDVDCVRCQRTHIYRGRLHGTQKKNL